VSYAPKDGVRYEARAKDAVAEYGRIGTELRVVRQRLAPTTTQGAGGFAKEYLDTKRVWHAQPTLKGGPSNPVFNAAAKDTHILAP